MNRKGTIFLSLVLILSMLALAACGGGEQVTSDTSEEKDMVVNLYTDRHYDTDEELYKLFTEETGIKVNVLKDTSDVLIEKLNVEGADTEADLLIATDAGRLFRAKDLGLFDTITSETVINNIEPNLRDIDNSWTALTVRARVLAYSLDRVDPADLSTYEALAEDAYAGKILVRSSTNIYNQSLMASIIAINGEDAAKEWAAGVLTNMARNPQGNDRAQATAVVAGEGDVAIMNTYYVGKMLNSEDAEEVKVAESIGVFFPNQDTTGTHINVSGIGITKHAKNKDNAVKFVEFMTSEAAQSVFAQANYEYPANKSVEPSDLLKSWGEFKAQDINLVELGKYNQRAVEIFNEVGWE